MSHAERVRHSMGARRGATGQSLVEVAIALPLLLFLAFAVVGAGRIVQARLGVSAVAREAARAGAQGLTAGAGHARGEVVAQGYGLTNGSLELLVDGGRFEPGGRVTGVASYAVDFSDLPLLGWAHVLVRGEAWEAIDLYRSVR